MTQAGSSEDGRPLAGKVALVTGASRGIGGGIAMELARKGANIAITYGHNAESAAERVAALKELGVDAEAYEADATNPATAEGLVARVVERFGQLDILVNNSGSYLLGKLGEITTESFDKYFNWNVKTPFLLASQAASVLPEGGRIINVGSINSSTVLFPGNSLYSATKGALDAFTRGWARDLADRAITVNNVLPGPIDTEGNPADGPFAPVLTQMTALGRFGTVDEVGKLVAWLSSSEAAYITGASIVIDGGIMT